MSHTTLTFTIGIDLGKRMSHFCILDSERRVHRRGRVRTTPEGLTREFSEAPKARMILEASSVSPWVDRLLRKLGHEVIVANPRNVALISKSQRKCDRRDAEFLARLGVSDLELISPITHRSEESQRDMAKIKIRDTLVRSRVRLIQSTRGSLESLGIPVASYSASSYFSRRLRESLSKEVLDLIEPALAAIDSLTKSIQEYDRALEQAIQARHPEAILLQTVPGVGPLISLSFVLTIEDPKRFQESRDVGAYLGLTPRRQQSGDSDPQLKITKTGNQDLRRLLIQGAHYILGPFGRDSDLREWGLKLAERGGKNAKKRAIVAVARKLAMILHRMWSTRTEFIARRSEPHVVVKHPLKSKKKEAQAIVA